MGNALHSVENENAIATENTTSAASNNRRGRRKRNATNTLKSTASDEVDVKRTKSSQPNSAHKKLFIDGCDSDISVSALGFTWNLHRTYLEQCGYFCALFSGNWNDTNRDECVLEILDTNITHGGLDNVFALLYDPELKINEDDLAGVLAAATMLNLNSVINRCAEILSTYTSVDKISICLRLAHTYGLMNVLNDALERLRLFLSRYSQSKIFLANLTFVSVNFIAHQYIPFWFEKILSTNVVCVYDEMDLYRMIKEWIYLQNAPHQHEDDVCLAEPCTSQLSSNRLVLGSHELNRDLSNVSEEQMMKFFHSDRYIWRDYFNVLRYLRVSQLTLHIDDYEKIRGDGVIPRQIIEWVTRDQWKTMLINENMSGILDDRLINDIFFYEHCFRLGRNYSNWQKKNNLALRWKGNFFGIDLLIEYDNGSLNFIRNCKTVTAPNNMSLKICNMIRIHYRVIVCDLWNNRKIFDSELRSTMLEIDVKKEVANFYPPRANFCVNIFYLASIPGPSSTYYWDHLMKIQRQYSKNID